MREIKNNIEIGKLPGADLKQIKVDASGQQQQSAEPQESSIKDFSNPTEILGRSQVSNADNLKSDVSFGVENSGAIASSDKLFDLAYNQLLKDNDPEAYEKACAISTSADTRDLLSH